MKKKLILLPLLMLVLASCVPNNNSSSETDSDTSGDTSSGTSADMTSDTSSDTTTDTSSDTTTDTSSGTSSDTSIDPVEKNEIDPTELNAILGYDVYSLLPKIYSNDYEVGDYASESYPVDVYIDLFDWELDDAIAYETALEGSLDVDEDNGYIVADNLYIFIYQDSQTYDVPVFGLNLYSIGEAPEKEEIDPTELNEIIGFDVYSQIPAIYSNDYEVGDYSSEDYPVDIYIYLYDWTFDDALAYDDELFASLDFDENYGYIIDENLFVFVNYDSDYSAAYINIYSDAAYEPFEPEVSAVWPADAINSFFGSADIGGLVPSFTSEADFSYYITGEDDYAKLIIYTDYATVDGEDIYVAALEAAGWVVDDSAYDYVGYVANDPDEQISLFFYWYEGVIYWSFMSFYHEPNPSDGSVIFDFSDESSLVTKDANLSIWNLEPVTMAIAKNTSATNVGNVSFFSNPLRIYGGQQVTFSIEENYVIDEIVITTDGASYASVVSSAVLTGGTVLVEGSVVTITADGSGEDIVIVPSAQTRWLSVDISYTVAIV